VRVSVVAPPPPVRSLSKPVPGYETSRLAPAPTPPKAATLSRFRAALDDLGSGKRAEPVRVLWLGDSHTAADFLPDALRSALAARYGDGGPGFVAVGRVNYRHSGAKVTRDGWWKTFPRRPSLWVKQDDGVFGLSGIRTVPGNDKSRAALQIQKALGLGPLRWDLAYRLPSRRSKFRLSTGEGAPRSVDATTCETGKVQHLVWETTRSTGITVDHAVLAPEILGVVVERVKSGVVVDTLGINGARIATPLAWDKPAWIEEIKRRRPALVVAAYGTNEIGDKVAPWRYQEHVETLVARVREGAPDADCVIIGPTDRLDSAWLPIPRTREIDNVERAAAERLGCWYVSALDVMAQSGGYRRWSALLPPLAARDGVHLTMRGYAEMGDAIARTLLGEPVTAP
jgi:lysophospholipase L1-like esterase